jgi:hypothetical protein
MSEQQQKTAEQIFKELSAPFTKEVNGQVKPDHKWLPKDGKSNATKFRCMPYISGGQVRDRLNEVLGVNGWMFESKLETDGTRTGSLSLYVNGEWISRDGVGVKSNQQGEKGAETDALKRAARNFGVGAYLEKVAQRFVDKQGKIPVDKNGRKLYGDDLHNYLNGWSSGQGIMMQLLLLDKSYWNMPEFQSLFNKLK